jgi:hypothetical protein
VTAPIEEGSASFGKFISVTKIRKMGNVQCVYELKKIFSSAA